LAKAAGLARPRLNATAGAIEHQIAPQWIRVDDVLG